VCVCVCVASETKFTWSSGTTGVVRILTQLRATLSHWACRGLPGHYIAVLILTLENDLVVDQHLLYVPGVPTCLLTASCYSQAAAKGPIGSMLPCSCTFLPRPSSILAAIGVSGLSSVSSYYYTIAATSKSLN